MFKLQRLEITGFKSFADYTEIVFTGNGITAVVGPNGCGKSNVSDCIAWVLGEQRAKSLRGGEMKDVVFQGSKNRKPSGMAEVILHLVRDGEASDLSDGDLDFIDQTLGNIDEHTIDMTAVEGDPLIEPQAPERASAAGNGYHVSEAEYGAEKVQAAQAGSNQTVERVTRAKRHWRPRSFALDFAPGDAVSVTRRLYLSGESEYELNGKTCRLRDIQDLFAGTGLSGAHYAIIEQERIGQILSAKPAERRGLIEEAAGISKFRTRQRAAETRLETAKSNLGRISDIVSEIDKQANALRRQASKTRRFIALQDEFRTMLRRLFAAESVHLSQALDDYASRLVEAKKTEADLAASVAYQEEKFRLSTHAARDAEEMLSDVRRRHAESSLERDRAQREHSYQSEQIVGLNDRLEAVRREIAAAEERLAALSGERARLEKAERAESAEAGAADGVLREAEDRYRAILAEVQQLEARLEENRGEHLQHATAVERFGEIGRQLRFNLARMGERVSGLARERIRSDEAFDQHSAEFERIKSELGAEQAKLALLVIERNQIFEQASSARVKLSVSEQELSDLSAEHSRVRNRLETLQELEEKRAVYPPQIQKLFASQDEIGVKLTGVLADFLYVNRRAEAAVEALFGSYLLTVVVDNPRDAEQVSEWASSGEVGRVATLVVPSRFLKRGEPATGGEKIEEWFGISTDLRDALRKVFPREMSAVLVESFDANLPHDVSITITFDADVLVGDSMRISGKGDGDNENASLLAFKRELTDLETSAAELSVTCENFSAAAARDRQDLAVLEEKAVDLQSLIIKIERHLVSLEAQATAAKQEIERAERHKKVIADESEQITAEIADLERRIGEADENMQTAHKLRTNAGADLEEIGRLVADARNRADAANFILSEKRTIAATSDERRRSAQSALRRLASEHRELESRIGILHLEVAEIEGRTLVLKDSAAALSSRLAASESDGASEAIELEAAIQTVSEARVSADAASEKLAELNRRSTEALNERSAIEVRQTEASTQLINLREKCIQDLGVELQELMAAGAADADFDLEAAQKAADDLRRRLDGFGAINMLAVEELVEAEDRLSFLASQRQDIIDSIVAAEEALGEIKDRSRVRFRQAFEAINENFVQYFQELFGGGRGEMTMLEADDILEAGIEIVAQPPGKRLQNILLLSGGEKSMTAIALVLAIFKYRPSPFCLLDEVDAPLDEANVGRFVNKIAEMSEKTQFIIITHNKRTMEAARALYGVTMQEAGVSKIVSVKFD